MWRRARQMRGRTTRPWRRHIRRRRRRPGSCSTAMKDAFPRRLSFAILPATCRSEGQGALRQEPFHKALLTGKTTHAAWRSKPSYYAVSTEDRTINPDLERFMAKRMGAKTIEVKASHLSLISQPDEISRLILEAAGQPA